MLSFDNQHTQTEQVYGCHLSGHLVQHVPHNYSSAVSYTATLLLVGLTYSVDVAVVHVWLWLWTRSAAVVCLYH